MSSLAQMTWTQSFFALILIFICLLLIVVILLQRGRGGGLTGAFGGAGGTSAFGAKTGDVFTWITVVVATVFIMIAVAANFAFDQSARPATPTVQTDGLDGLLDGPDAAVESTVDDVTGFKVIELPIDPPKDQPFEITIPAADGEPDTP